MPTKGASGCILGGGRLRSSPTSGPLRKERGPLGLMNKGTHLEMVPQDKAVPGFSPDGPPPPLAQSLRAAKSFRGGSCEVVERMPHLESEGLCVTCGQLW